MVVRGLWTRRGSLALWSEGGAPESDRLPAPWATVLARPARSRLQVLVPSDDPADGGHEDEPAPLDVRTVRVVHVAPADALDLLADLHAWRSGREAGGDDGDGRGGREGTGAAAHDEVVGAELVWLTEVAAVVTDRVRAGAVVPTLAAGAIDDGWTARWAPLHDPAWRRWVLEARACLPAALRAEVSDSGTGDRHPGGRAGAEVVDAVTAALTDAAVRTALAREGEDERDGLVPSAGAGLPAVTHAWVRALLTDEPPAEPLAGAGATEADLRGLAERVRAWGASATSAPVELVLRVLEPTVADAVEPGAAPSGAMAAGAATDPDDLADPPGWALQVRLRSLDDPSLLLTAEQVRQGVPGLVWSLDADPWAWTLTELARAGAAWPPLLADPADGGLGAGGVDADTPLEVGALLALVTEGAAALTEAGVAVQLPGRWLRPEPSLRLAAAAADPAGGAVRAGGLDARALVDYSWRVALGDTVLTEEELRALAAAKEPLVRLRGEWVQVDPDRLARSLAFLTRTGGPGTGGLAAVMGQLATAALPEAVSGVDATGALADLLAGRADAVAPVAVPADLRATLRPYQERGLAWLASMAHLGLGVVLADDMGLGKTVQLLALLLHEHEEARGGSGPPAPTLLVCPMSLVGNWAREAARFAPTLRVHVHHGPDRPAGPALAEAVAGADLVVTTYAIAVRDQDDLAAQRWGRVALDEAQHVKNSATRGARAVRAIAAGASGPRDHPGPARDPAHAAHRVHRVALTGTPVENHLGELRSVLDFAVPGVLGSAHRFRERFAVPIERHGDARATAALATLTRPFVLRRVKTDPAVISDLPPKIEMTVHATLTAEQATLYQAVLDDMLARVAEADGEPGARAGLVLATLTRLKQVCNHPAQMLGDGSPLLRRGQHRSGKLALVDDVLDTVAADGERALCFTQYRALGEMLSPHLADRLGADVEFLHGGVPRRKREEMVERFSGPGGPPAMVVSLKAGGTGLNLVAANHVVHVDRWWNPAVEAQATDRAFRIGQTRTVQVRTLVCAGTVEERVDEMMRAKRELAAAVVPTGEAWLTAMSTEELREVLTLGADSVGD